MTRGKNQKQVAGRAVHVAQTATETLRASEQRERRLMLTIGERDAEITQLKLALTSAREAHTTPGTHTDADLAKALQEARQKHVVSIQRGLAYLEAKGVAIIPARDIAGFCEAFDIDMKDVLGDHARSRMQRRATKRVASMIDEIRRQGGPDAVRLRSQS